MTDVNSSAADLWSGRTLGIRWRTGMWVFRFNHFGWTQKGGVDNQSVDVLVNLPESLVNALLIDFSFLDNSALLKQRVGQALQVQGNVDLIKSLPELFRVSLPDIESLMAEKMGDLPAVYFIGAGRRVGRVVLTRLKVFLDALLEFVVEKDGRFDPSITTDSVKQHWRKSTEGFSRRFFTRLEQRVAAYVLKSEV
jgi:hypothetical protein